MNSIRVNLPHHSYPIYIGQEILASRELLCSHIKGKQVFIVTQKSIPSEYLETLERNLQEYQCMTFFLEDGEHHKSIASWEKMLTTLLQNHYERTATLIALGGGVVGDITGFVAACYQRGVNYIQIPTTLMGQVDSAIGGKTAVNHPLGKNMIGAFYQPQCVIADVSVLCSLSERDYISGLAEVVKYGLIYDAEFFYWLEKNYQAVLNRDLSALLHMVTRCASIKAEIISQDEKDHGLRNLLNFGHTFGHALEALLGYKNILHGEAVFLGMEFETQLSLDSQLLAENDAQRIIQFLNKIFSREHLPSYNLAELKTFMMRDKKVKNSKLNFILLKKIGEGVAKDFSSLPQCFSVGEGRKAGYY